MPLFAGPSKFLKTGDISQQIFYLKPRLANTLWPLNTAQASKRAAMQQKKIEHNDIQKCQNISYCRHDGLLVFHNPASSTKRNSQPSDSEPQMVSGTQACSWKPELTFGFNFTLNQINLFWNVTMPDTVYCLAARFDVALPSRQI
ncbi:hypothetical protein CHS0354_001154 [Potamilus streckersoni]|uniref:Uncharacterized protein n=1 Tax=Potamilus streckersoni TaxID=2493646 RepID=A0AAE0S7R8_9BIVA|nr:hypothetical protein CHS0354_001154 [Potamilus streckersoni]